MTRNRPNESVALGRAEANPYDPSWEEYYEGRLQAKMAATIAGRDLLLALYERQEGRCVHCGELFAEPAEWRPMSVCVHYWAIPPISRLYARLQEDRAFNALMASLFPYGCGVYQFHTIEPEEAEEIFDDIVERHHAALGSETEARQRITEFLAQLECTRAEFPGIERRAYMIENCSSDIEQRLTQMFQKERTDATNLVQKIMFGDKLLAAHLRQPGEDILGLVSQPVVREGAAALERLNPEEVFPSGDGWPEWYRDNYEGWRQMYLETARHAEEILVGVT